jgi:hypothetical protein
MQHTHITPNMSTHTPLSSPRTFDVQDPAFPKYLPLRPDKPPFFRRTSTRIALAILLSLFLIAAAGVGALFTGKHLQTTKYEQHPDVASTIVVTPSKVVSTAMVTEVNVVVSMMTVLVSSARRTVVVTMTADEQVSFASCVAGGGEGCWGAGVEDSSSVVTSGR